MDPIDLQAVKALTDALAEISVADGYAHDLAGKVFRGRMLFADDNGDPLPCVTIIEPPQMPDAEEAPLGSSVALTKLPLLIQGFAEDDRDNPTDPAYRLRADVKKRLATEQRRGRGSDILGMGGRVAALHIGQGVVRSPDALVSDTAFFWLPVTLEIAMDNQNPFA